MENKQKPKAKPKIMTEREAFYEKYINKRGYGVPAGWFETADEQARFASVALGNIKTSATYEDALAALREYAQRQKQCGNPAELKDLREYRRWKNMPQDAAFDAALLAEVNAE